MNLWIFAKLLWGTPFGDLKIEKIQGYIAVVASIVWLAIVPTGLLLGY
jgi:hypothetical protein